MKPTGCCQCMCMCNYLRLSLGVDADNGGNSSGLQLQVKLFLSVMHVSYTKHRSSGDLQRNKQYCWWGLACSADFIKKDPIQTAAFIMRECRVRFVLIAPGWIAKASMLVPLVLYHKRIIFVNNACNESDLCASTCSSGRLVSITL